MGTAIVLMSLLLPAGMSAGKGLEALNHKMATAELERIEEREAPTIKRRRMGDVFDYSQFSKKRKIKTLESL